MGMLNGDMGQDDTIGEDDFGGESGLGGMDPETGMANIGSWATAKDPNRTMSQVMGLFDDDPIAMAKGYGPKGVGYAYSDSFDFSKSAKEHTNFVVDLMDKSFQAKYGKSLKESKNVYDAMTKDEKEAMKADAMASTKGILSGIPDAIKDEVAQGVNVSIANMMGYGPQVDTDTIPDWFGLPVLSGWTAAAKTALRNARFTAYNIMANTDAQIANMLGEEPGTSSPDMAALEGGNQ